MKTIYFLFGLLFLVIGVVGIFIPVWPTTPFVLVSIFLFGKSNKDFKEYIMSTKWLGKHLRNYYDNRTMSKAFKIKTILFLWTGLTLAMIVTRNLTVMIILIIVGVSVSCHIVLLKESKIL